MAQQTFTNEKKIEIVCAFIKKDLTVQEINELGVKTSTLYYWKTKYFPNTTEEKYEASKLLELIRADVELRGINKEYFAKDCYLRDWTYGKMLRNIVDFYYTIHANRPEGAAKEMAELKKMLNDKVKFK